MFPEAAYEAGLLDDLGGLKGRSAPIRQIWRPAEVDLEGGRLRWHGGLVDPVDPKANLLAQFIGLKAAPASRILQFAKSWGPLYLCKHDLPSTHNRGAFNPRPCHPRGWSATAFRPISWEPIKAWRTFASRAEALLNIAAHIQLGKVAPIEEWEASGEDLGQRTWFNSLPASRWALASAINQWLDLGNVRPHVEWQPLHRHPTVTEGGSSLLFGALAVQLMLAAVKANWAVCSWCKAKYLPERRPKAGQYNYCPACRDAGVPIREAKARARQNTTGGKQ